MQPNAMYSLNAHINAEIASALPTALEWFDEIYDFHKLKGHDKKNEYETYDGDISSYYIPSPEGKNIKVMVMGSWWKYGGNKMIAIVEEGRACKTITVLKASKKMKFSKSMPDVIKKYTAEFLAKHNFNFHKIDGIYGDCSEKQFIMKCNMYNFDGKIEYHFEAPCTNYLEGIRSFFDELNSSTCSIEADLKDQTKG